MDEKRFRCRHCGKLRVVRVKGQRYCGEDECQQARRNRWRREKLHADPDYRMNQRESTEAWFEAQGGAAVYHRAYRDRRKLKVKGGQKIPCTRQGEMQRAAADGGIESGNLLNDACGVVSAKRDASLRDMPIKTGRYVLFSELAKRDGYLVEIRLISSG